MKRFVLDCSVSAAWCLRDESSKRADRCLDLLADGEALVPSLWVTEMTNVLLTAERRRRITAEDAATALDLLGRLPILVQAENAASMPRTYGLARKHRLSAYDACYLDLAIESRLPLASLDDRMRKAAKAARVRLV